MEKLYMKKISLYLIFLGDHAQTSRAKKMLHSTNKDRGQEKQKFKILEKIDINFKSKIYVIVHNKGDDHTRNTKLKIITQKLKLIDSLN